MIKPLDARGAQRAVAASLLVIGLVIGGGAAALAASVTASHGTGSDIPARIIAVPSSTPQSQQAATTIYACAANKFSPLSVLVLDSGGQPVSGVTVTFSAPSTGPAAVFGGNCNSTEQDVTDGLGIAISPDAYENGVVGSYQVTASAPGVSAPAVFSLTNTSGVPASLTAVQATTPQSAQVGTAFGSDLKAALANSSGVPLEGVPVTFTAYDGLDSGLTGRADGAFTGGRSTVTEDTDADGIAAAPTLTANSRTGPFMVIASAPDAYQPAVFNLTNGTQSTSTTLTLTSAKATYGHEQTEHLSVTVSPRYPGTPTGTVTITSAQTILCTITLRPSAHGKGSCSLLPAELSARNYGLIAHYRGAAGYPASASRARHLAIARSPTKTALTLSAATVRYGHEQAEHLSVTVSPKYAGTPAGTVTIKAGKTAICTITLSHGNGSCKVSSKALRPGVHKLVAAYQGDMNFAASIAKPKSLTVTG
jgi:hypothetical protein